MSKKIQVIKLFLVLITSLYIRIAVANDTLGMITTSGLVFKESKNISMESEELYISLDKIKVKYNFLNNSNQGISETVIFPLPEINSEALYRINYDILSKSSNPLQFKLKINGKEMPIKMYRKEVCKQDFCTLQMQYYWEQVFPANQLITVEHEYLVVPGRGSMEDENYCKNTFFDQGLKKLALKVKNYSETQERMDEYHHTSFSNDYFPLWLHYHNYEIGYILKTGANWQGSIKQFKMTVDKGLSDNLISLCWNGLKKIDSTRFIYEQKNFIPTQDLKILIIAAKGQKMQ